MKKKAESKVAAAYRVGELNTLFAQLGRRMRLYMLETKPRESPVTLHNNNRMIGIDRSLL
jgi:hypothetical protein